MSLARGTKVLVGIRDGVLTVVDPVTERHVSIPWPPPPPKDRHGSWQPARVGQGADGTPVLLWQWEPFLPGRADEPRPEPPPPTLIDAPERGGPRGPEGAP